jgi:histidine triad (HIT) family protein
MRTDENCLFCKIIKGEIPSEKVYEDDRVLAFKDINPQAPTHILLIPKDHIARIDEVTESDRDLMGYLMEMVAVIAKQEGLSEQGFRTVINCGESSGQEVFHIHLHIMGGRSFSWPAG